VLPIGVEPLPFCDRFINTNGTSLKKSLSLPNGASTLLKGTHMAHVPFLHPSDLLIELTVCDR
jgi:hypothetical protein